MPRPRRCRAPSPAGAETAKGRGDPRPSALRSERRANERSVLELALDLLLALVDHELLVVVRRLGAVGDRLVRLGDLLGDHLLELLDRQRAADVAAVDVER